MTFLQIQEYVVTITTETGTQRYHRMAFTAREATVPILAILPDTPFGLTVTRATPITSEVQNDEVLHA